MLRNFTLILGLVLIFNTACQKEGGQEGYTGRNIGITWLTEPPGPVDQYDLLELEFTFQKKYENPYDADEVAVDLVITGEKDTTILPCFYSEGYTFDESLDKLSPSGKSSWKARYTPDKPGKYDYFIRIRDSEGISRSKTGNFTVNSHPGSGFLRKYTENYLLFDDGSPFVVNSFNLSVPPRKKPLDYEYFFRKFKANRMNYTRLWLAPPWGEYAFALEWTDRQFPSQKGKLGLKRYNQEVAARLDDFIRKAEDYGIYVMLCLGDERELETGTYRNEKLPPSRPFWHANPYNRENGGPAATPLEFFIRDSAKAIYKNRLRYLIARWGYSTHLIIWEFWNEIDHSKWCQDWTFVKQTIADWHCEMGKYLRQNDPYHHLISTSFAQENNQPLIWNLPEMDVVQGHSYGGAKDLAKGVIDMTTELKAAFPQKPMYISEYGTDFHGYTHEGGAEEVGIHNSIWASALSGATGTTEWWWWDEIDEDDLYHHYNDLGIFIENIPWLECKTLDLVTGYPEILATGLGTSDKAWIWVHNTNHNWDNAKYKRHIRELTDVKIVLNDFPAGDYEISEFNTYSGEFYPARKISFNSSPEIAIQTLKKDKAFFIEKSN